MPAIQELASEFKLLRKDIQAIRNSLERIETLLSQPKTNPQP